MSITSRLLALAAVAATASIGSASSPASADQPTTSTDVVEFIEDDPCDPSQAMTTRLTIVITEHTEHPNNFVSTARIFVETSTGYSGTGHTSFVGGPQFFSSTDRIMVSNADTDQRYIVESHFNGNPSGIVVADFDIVCLRGLVSA